jgi:NAD(P)-dependent dehydrogenase (short-subunit alcohol dehydrogenase family)
MAEMSVSLQGQKVVVIGGSAGIGLETARRARAEGAVVILTGRNPAPLAAAARDVDARSTAAFDATDPVALERFFRELSEPIDHIFISAGGSYYAPLAEIDFDQAHHELDAHLWLPLHCARLAVDTVRAGGSMTLISGTGARRPGIGLTVVGALTAAMPALVRNLALELAPIRVNLIAAGFVDTPLSASLLGDQLEERRTQLRETLPIRRVVEPEDVAELGVHLMVNTALTGGTYDIDGGQQLL